jgi:hypothetical protein
MRGLRKGGVSGLAGGALTTVSCHPPSSTMGAYGGGVRATAGATSWQPHFADLIDPRLPRSRRPELRDGLARALGAVGAGVASWPAGAAEGRANQEGRAQGFRGAGGSGRRGVQARPPRRRQDPAAARAPRPGPGGVAPGQRLGRRQPHHLGPGGGGPPSPRDHRDPAAPGAALGRGRAALGRVLGRRVGEGVARGELRSSRGSFLGTADEDLPAIRGPGSIANAFHGGAGWGGS